MERGVTGPIDHSATLCSCWSVHIPPQPPFPFFLILLGDMEDPETEVGGT